MALSQDEIDLMNLLVSIGLVSFLLVGILILLVLVFVWHYRYVKPGKRFLYVMVRVDKYVSVSELMGGVEHASKETAIRDVASLASSDEFGHSDFTKHITVELPQEKYKYLAKLWEATFYAPVSDMSQSQWLQYTTQNKLHSVGVVTSDPTWGSMTDAERYASVATVGRWKKAREAGVQDKFNFAQEVEREKENFSQQQAKQMEVYANVTYSRYLQSTEEHHRQAFGSSRAGGGEMSSSSKKSKRRSVKAPPGDRNRTTPI